MRYVVDRPAAPETPLDRVHQDVLTLNQNLGYDFNTVEFAVHDGVPYAIDFCNPAPDADRASVGEKNFAWVVDAAARMAIRKAKEHQPGKTTGPTTLPADLANDRPQSVISRLHPGPSEARDRIPDHTENTEVTGSAVSILIAGVRSIRDCG